MPNAHDPLENLRIAAPCQTSWESMAGDERMRHCTLCSLNVYNFAEMTRDEVRELLARTEGRVCARLYRRADGTVITRDCPTGLRALRRRASRVAAALVATLVSLPAFAFGGKTCEKPRLRIRGSKVKLTIERIATPQRAVFDGVVRLDDVPVPGVIVTVQNETTKRQFRAVTDSTGTFNFASLNDGIYRVEVKLEGFKTAKVEHLELKASEATHASVSMQPDSTETITLGAIAYSVLENQAISATYAQDFINKLPL